MPPRRRAMEEGETVGAQRQRVHVVVDDDPVRANLMQDRFAAEADVDVQHAPHVAAVRGAGFYEGDAVGQRNDAVAVVENVAEEVAAAAAFNAEVDAEGQALPQLAAQVANANQVAIANPVAAADENGVLRPYGKGAGVRAPAGKGGGKGAGKGGGKKAAKVVAKAWPTAKEKAMVAVVAVVAAVVGTLLPHIAPKPTFAAPCVEEWQCKRLSSKWLAMPRRMARCISPPPALALAHAQCMPHALNATGPMCEAWATLKC